MQEGAQEQNQSLKLRSAGNILEIKDQILFAQGTLPPIGMLWTKVSKSDHPYYDDMIIIVSDDQSMWDVFTLTYIVEAKLISHFSLFQAPVVDMYLRTTTHF